MKQYRRNAAAPLCVLRCAVVLFRHSRNGASRSRRCRRSSTSTGRSRSNSCCRHGSRSRSAGVVVNLHDLLLRVRDHNALGWCQSAGCFTNVTPREDQSDGECSSLSSLRAHTETERRVRLVHLDPTRLLAAGFAASHDLQALGQGLADSAADQVGLNHLRPSPFSEWSLVSSREAVALAARRTPRGDGDAGGARLPASPACPTGRELQSVFLSAPKFFFRNGEIFSASNS